MSTASRQMTAARLPPAIVAAVIAAQLITLPAAASAADKAGAVTEDAATTAVTAGAAGPKPTKLAAPRDRQRAKALDAILRRAPGKPQIIGLAVDVETGEVAYSEGAEASIYPASVAKLFSTAAAIRALGPKTRLTTRVLASPTSGPTRATLAIVGAGDPTLTGDDLTKLAKAVAGAGVRRVSTLVIDTTLFDEEEPRGYDEKETDASYRAPIDALEVNASAVTVVVYPGSKPSEPLRVVTRPPSRAIVVDQSEASTVAGRKRDLVVTTRRGKGRRTVVVVRGTLGSRARAVPAGRRRVHSAAGFAGGAFEAALIDAGVAVDAVRFGAAPAELRELATHDSAPLKEIINTTNKTSNNVYAETLFKLIGAAHIADGGDRRPATAEDAEAGARAALTPLSLHWDGVRLGNGSGLYHATKVTARAVVDLLRGMWASGELGAQWRGTLAIAGVAGTLRRRLRSPGVKGQVFAKTGTLNDVTALAGYAKASDRTWAFALFFNRTSRGAGRYRRVHDRFLERLVGAEASKGRGKRSQPKTKKRPKRHRKPHGKRRRSK